MLDEQMKQQWLQDNALQVLDTAVDAIVTIDATGIIQFVNQATLTLFGYTEQELIGQPVSILMAEPHRSAHQSYVDHYLDSGEAQIIGIGRELVAARKNGQEFPVYLAINEIETDDHRYFTGIVRDLTEQKAAQAALLEQRDRLAHAGRLSTMGEMTASIAHEINQPLTAIAMYAQASLKMLERDDISRDKLKDALEKLNAQALRAGAVIERIQRFVRNEGGSREPTDINLLLTDLRHFVTGDAVLHGVELDFRLDDTLPKVFCDPIEVQQVALNLVRNAIDAMEEVACRFGNIVTIETSVTPEDLVEVAVVDCGTGVREDHQRLVFSSFHTTKKNGMGMGLSICRSIIETHGGTLDFRNNPDHGATFYFQLPQGDNHEQ